MPDAAPRPGALDPMAKYPLTSQADLRENYPTRMFAVPREQVLRIHASSGTTGRATVVGYTRDDLDVWSSLMARPIRAAGGRGICCTMPTATGCSPGGSARTMARRSSAAR